MGAMAALGSMGGGAGGGAGGGIGSMTGGGLGGYGLALQAIGNGIGAFGTEDVDTYRYNRPANKALNWMAKTFPKLDNATVMDALAKFAASNPETIAALKALAKTTIGDTTNIYNKLAGADPFAQFQNTTNYLLGKAGGLVPTLYGGMSRAAKSNISALSPGYVSPGSSTADAILNREVASSMLPIYNTIFANSGNTTANLSGAQRANLGDAMNALQYRLGLPLQGYGMELDPAKALFSLRGSQVGNLLDIVNASKANTAGYSVGPGGLQRAGNAISSIGGGGGGSQSAQFYPTGGGAAPASTSSASSGGSGQGIGSLLSMLFSSQQRPSGGLTVNQPGTSPSVGWDY